jgi:hypothetical protein
MGLQWDYGGRKGARLRVRVRAARAARAKKSFEPDKSGV